MFALTLLFILQLEDQFEIISLYPNGTQTVGVETQKYLGNQEVHEEVSPIYCQI